ncbi:MAG: proton-conducting transporter membrane subunit [Sulfurimonas sp.]|nr:proton-conducting transporter membrane subunit [Sulfurimonas sp.]
MGINLYVDGLSLLMLGLTALIGVLVTLYSTKYFTQESSILFWPLYLFMTAGLNALFLSQDIFNFYVTLELIGLASVALSTLSSTKEALTGAMRYLLVTLAGSLAYLLGVALLYHGFGSVDISILSQKIESTPVVWAAMGLMSAGLLLKSALFPFHFWLPPAHANAPAPISAILSALIIKASIYIQLRLVLYLFMPLGDIYLEVLFGVLGTMAIVWGSVQALLQTRLKLLIAYSTVAQIGYIFIAFSLAIGGVPIAWNALVYLILSHALAKSAMFLVAGNLLHFCGHDRITDLDRLAQRLPLSITAFALAGVSIIGLPISGGFIAKWFLLEAALIDENWIFILVILVGGLLAAAYIFKVLGFAFTKAPQSHEGEMLSPYMEFTPLILAILSIVIGFFAIPILSLVEIGNPFNIAGVRP